MNAFNQLTFVQLLNWHHVVLQITDYLFRKDDSLLVLLQLVLVRLFCLLFVLHFEGTRTSQM